ncbi:MAG: hypothetical protein H7177_02755 [Rhizobacter sp.]|nr:hypothetical protein [Bacteriovorax sp.]
MIKNFIYLLILVTLASCGTFSRDPGQPVNDKTAEEILDQAEKSATPGGRKVLEVSRSMIASQEIIIGGCWDYINGVYNRAGFPDSARVTTYKSKFQGPYFKSEDITTGDWLYFVNHSFSESEHSAIFVTWTNFDTREALMVSYVGGKKKKPATYKLFKLNKVYNVFRPKEN